MKRIISLLVADLLIITLPLAGLADPSIDSTYTIMDSALLSADTYTLQIHFIVDMETEYFLTTEETSLGISTDMLSIYDDLLAAYEESGVEAPVDVEVCLMYGRTADDGSVEYSEWSAWSDKVSFVPEETD